MVTRVQTVGAASGRRGKRLPRAVRELQMLDAAVTVFARHGFHAASMDEIAEVAGVSKPMVYAYLGSKEELFRACLHREATRLLEAIVGAVEPQAPPDEQLWHGLRGFFGFVAAHRDGWSVLYRQARSQEPFAGEVAAVRARLVDVVGTLLAQAAEGIRPVRPAELTALAYALVGAGESLADWAVDNVDTDPEVSASRLMNLVWLGFGQLLAGGSWCPAGAARDASSG